MKLLEDKPISKKLDDLLGRSEFVDWLKATVLSCDNYKESFVVWLNWKRWEWKTSVLKMLDSEICCCEADVMWFSPWLYNDSLDIQKKFFDEFWVKLWISNRSRVDEHRLAFLDYKREVVWWSMKTLTNFEIPPKWVAFEAIAVVLAWWIPYVASLSVYFSPILIWLVLVFWKYLYFFFFDREKLRLLKNRNGIEKLRWILHKNLAGRSKKIICIIDDLDRLEPDQLKSILQLVKASCNFPNVVYILSYDEDIVKNQLSDIFRENDYLSKIVQLKLDLPKIDNKIITSAFESSFRIFIQPFQNRWLFKQETSSEWIKSTLSDAYFNDWLQKFFPDLRSIKRYFNSLSSNLNAVQFWYTKEEVSLIDFMIVESFKLFDKKLFDSLYDLKSTIFGPAKNWNDKLKLIQDWVSGVNSSNSENLVAKLFPALKFTDGHAPNELFLEPRLATNHSFDKYFQLKSLWMTETNFDEINALLKISDVDNAIKWFNSLNERGLWLDVLQKLDSMLFTNERSKPTMEWFTYEYVVSIMMFALNVEDKISFKAKWIFDTLADPSTNVMRILFHWMKRLSSDPTLYMKWFTKVLDSRNLYQIYSYFYNRFIKDDYQFNQDKDSYVNRIWKENIDKLKDLLIVWGMALISSEEILLQYKRFNIIRSLDAINPEWLHKKQIWNIRFTEESATYFLKWLIYDQHSQSVAMFWNGKDWDIVLTKWFYIDSAVEYLDKDELTKLTAISKLEDSEKELIFNSINEKWPTNQNPN